MDITYYDSGYIDQNYYVYTADAFVDLGPFIVEDYLEPDYFENTGIAVTLSCEATRVRFIEAAADLVANFSQSVNGVIDVRAEVTLVTIANLASQEIRVREFNSDLVTEFTHTASASATFSPQVTFSSIASQLTAAFQNATGTITMESAFTVTAIIGVIREYVPNSNSGLKPIAVSGNYPQIYPDNITGSFGAETISVWVKRDTSSSEGEILYAGTPSNNTGFINYDSAGTITVADQGFAQLFTITWNAAMPADTDWHHLFFKYRSDLGGFYGDGYQLFIDGVSKGSREFQSVSAGILSFTGPYGNSIGVGNHHLAQLRIGGAINLYDVYDGGYIDLGENGRGAFDQLPLPGIFSTLDRPWSNVYINQEYQPQYLSSTAVLPVPDMQANSLLQVEILAVLVVSIDMISTAVMEITASKTVEIVVAVSSEFTTATDNQILRLATATLSTDSELACTVTVQRSSAVDLSASSTLSVESTRIFASTVDLAAEFAVTATVGETTEFYIDLNSAFTQVTEISRTRDLASALELAASISTNAVKTIDVIAAVSSEFTTTVVTDRTRDHSVTLESAATVTATYTRIPAISVTLTSEFTQTADAEKLIVSQGTLSAEFTQSTVAFKVVNGTGALVVEGFQLTQGDILNFDPCREIAVESETRLARILPENRLIIVDQETRTLKVPQETRVLRVDYETRVNIIKC